VGRFDRGILDRFANTERFRQALKRGAKYPEVKRVAGQKGARKKMGRPLMRAAHRLRVCDG